ncbi:MAG: HAD family hydrolase [Elainellaceae cyanobacterium]
MVSIRCGDRLFDNLSAVIFDKDGTLADPGDFLLNLARRRTRLVDARIPGVQEPLLMAMGVLDGAIDPAGLMAVGSYWETSIAAAAYVAETGRGWRESLKIVEASFAEADQAWGNKAPHTPMFEDALPCLQRLHGTGLKLGIASADTPENVAQFVEHYGLSKYFSAQLGSDRYLAKPSSAFLAKACTALGVTPSQVLIVGDSLTDVELARQSDTAGCILVDRGGTNGQAVSAADTVVPELTALEICGSP